jgi:DNA repair photolyase
MLLTPRCREVLAEFRNPIVIITKNGLVARDRDVLSELAGFDAAAVNISITSLDPEIQRRMEPRASHPEHRLRAIERLAEAGIPVGVMVAPVVPGLTDHEIPGILEAAAGAGATFAGLIVLRLPHAVKDLFEDWLERNYPDRKNKVMNRIRSLRGGRLNDPRFGSRMHGEGVFASEIQKLFKLAARRAGLHRPRPVLSADHFRLPGAPQLELF